MRITKWTALLIWIPLSVGCGTLDEIVRIESPNFRIEINRNMESRVITSKDGSSAVLGDFRPSEYLLLEKGPIQGFQVERSDTGTAEGDFGRESFVSLTGNAEGIEKEVLIRLPEDFPSTAICVVKYTNKRPEPLTVLGWVNNHYQIKPMPNQESEYPFWSYQSASYEDRRDWVLPLKSGFSQENYLGMNASDYGGGTPIVDIWRPDYGVAVGHLMGSPKLNSLPVKVDSSGNAELAVRFTERKILAPGESLTTFLTFVTVHSGDYFYPLRQYRLMMERGVKEIRFQPFPESAYQPVWCAWGYEREFTMKQVYGTLPKAKELGFEWAVLDDGWQTAEGDWYLKKDKFPRGDRDMKRLTAKIRDSGMRPKLWWVPLAVDPETDLMKEHPDFILINEKGKPQDISWWDSYYLCPAYPPVREYTKALVRKIISDWDYDGLKIDGQHLNGVPPCYNPAHHHASPNDSVEALPGFFKDIYDSALAFKSDAVVEICPCGTSYNFFTMPYMNQPVSSDPLSSWQIRHKGKTFKALMGSSVPYYGDHVELSDGRNDFATTIGIGAVPGSKFTWPVGAKKDSRIDLTADKEKVWARWIQIYKEKMLSKGEYLGNLYDIGFDRPETHAISVNGKMYYAFYAEEFKGQVELRELKAASYRVVDYVNGVDFGVVKGPIGLIDVDFQGSLLLEAAPTS